MFKVMVAASIFLFATSLAIAEDDAAFNKALRFVEDASIISLCQEYHHLQLSETESMRLVGSMARSFLSMGISSAETERTLKRIFPTTAGEKGDTIFKQRYSSRYHAYYSIILMPKHSDASPEEAKIFSNISDQICLAKKAEFLK